MIYVILPKLGEAPDWGYSEDEVLIVKAINTDEARYGKAHFKKYLEGQPSILPLPETGIVCYADEGISVDVRPRYRELLHTLLPVERKVFRHFGSDPLQNMSTVKMQANMLSSYDAFWEEKHVMPFSEKGGSDAAFRWLPLIRDVRQRCFIGASLSVDEAMTKLNEAWTLADCYYNCQLHMRKMLEMLFPLYLTLSGDESAEDRAAAIQAAKQAIDQEAFRPVREGIEANVGDVSKGMRLSNNLTLPASPDLPNDFITWFKELSKAYTKILGLDNEVDPFGRAAH